MSWRQMGVNPIVPNAAMEAFVAQNRRGKHGRVVYDLARDFGLDPATVRRRFDFYFERFAVQPED